ncbi:MAG TPA: 4'-phosphopantetheinyl transferase superfamily protein [Candidatus Krumholzibacteria bacterium]|nr:4'-phosphopantetheinyl transferase superfamily protein [Candidatus Krumholzibacteria bacterium]
MQSPLSTAVTSAVAASFYVPIADDECRTQSCRSSTWCEDGLVGWMRLPVSACVEMFSDVPLSTMFPVEIAAVANAVTQRRREFATVRYCAREALRKIGVTAVPILSDADGVPRWPVGVVGSMTHCAGYRAAVVARCDDLLGVGIDAEPHAPVPAAVLDFMLREEESAQLSALSESRPDLHWDRIFFCAKESAYKTWFPLTRRWLDFADLSVELSVGGTFEAHVLVREPGLADSHGVRIGGQWVVDRGLVVATTCLRRVPAMGIRRRDPSDNCRGEASGFGGRG